jgi:flagellar biogenesis protein FliO
MSFDKLPFVDTNFDAYEAKMSAKICVVLLRIIIGAYLVIRLMEQIYKDNYQ